MLWYLRGVLLGWSAVLGLGLVLGCTRAEAPARWVGTPAPSISGAIARGGSSPSGAPPASADLALTVTRSRPRSSAPGSPVLEIQAPRAEQRIEAEDSAAFEVRFTVSGIAAGEGGVVEAMVDSFRPHAVSPGEPVRLERLIPEDVTLERGLHRLFMVITRDGLGLRPAAPGARGPAALVEFSIGEPSGASAPRVRAPQLVLLRPEGTYNGDAADRVPLDLHLVGASLGSRAIRLSIRGVAGGFTTLLPDAEPRVIVGMPSGDFEVAAWLVDPQGLPIAGAGARGARTITVNREVGVPGDAAP